MYKVISFRLNLKHAEEREIYEMLQRESSESHESCGAFIKEILAGYAVWNLEHRKAQHMQEVLREFKESLLNEQERVLRAVLHELGSIEVPKQIANEIESTENDALPDQVAEFLAGLSI